MCMSFLSLSAWTILTCAGRVIEMMETSSLVGMKPQQTLSASVRNIGLRPGRFFSFPPMPAVKMLPVASPYSYHSADGIPSFLKFAGCQGSRQNENPMADYSIGSIKNPWCSQSLLSVLLRCKEDWRTFCVKLFYHLPGALASPNFAER